MKYNKHILLPMTLAMLSVTTSCEQEELSPALPEGDFVEVRTNIGSHETRVAQPEDNKYVFEDGDKIHIVSWYDANPNVYPQLYKFENPEKPGTYLW
ncbi:MAG: fimbrillin family protein, partial [Prevotella sp.]|nr:fimbrillin family protein [Prevotella sp.]